MSSRPVISIVDDDDDVRVSLDSLLRSYGFTIQLFDSAEEFMASGQAVDTDCLISDIQMPGMSGLGMFERLVSQGIHIPVIFITASVDQATKLAAQRLGATGYLMKPFDGAPLLAFIKTALSSKSPD